MTNEPRPKRAAYRFDGDSRELCFSQGKPCVRQSESDPNTIVTEWPNGVVEDLDLRSMTVTRRWPDGATETFPEDSLENERYPHRPHAEPQCHESPS
ncbi:MAG: hypothetical protein OXG35_22300 [Acidobacteria bacterium]|nr:hypothetical protein [Acidobacteriota bacterium]